MLTLILASAFASTRVEICHWDAMDGAYEVIRVQSRAVAAHFAHGDSYPAVYHPDLDGDGHGDPDGAIDACPDPGFVADDTDCDDTEPAAWDGAAELDDLVDNDCDGWVDEDYIVEGDIIVSEVVRQPRLGTASTVTNGQWFEVYNTSGRDIDLSNWYVRRHYVNDVGFYVDPADAVYVPAGGYAVLCNRDDYTAANDPYSTLVCDYFYTDETQGALYSDRYHANLFLLYRDQDTLELWLEGDHTTGRLIDDVHWTYNAYAGYWPWGARMSMSLDPMMLDGMANDDRESWCSVPLTAGSAYLWYYVSSAISESGTPGAANYPCP